MRPVTDDFLMSMAEISSALVGLFLVGVFFYAETSSRASAASHEADDPYMKASTRIVLVLYAIPIGMSLALVALEPVWGRILFAVLSAILVAANVSTVSRLRSSLTAMASPVLVLTEVAGTLAVIGIVTLPWILGGLDPTREDLMWAILLSFAAGFLSVCAMVLTAFDMARR